MPGPPHHTFVLTLAGVTLALAPLHLAVDWWPANPYATIPAAAIGWILTGIYLFALAHPDPPPPRPRPEAIPGTSPGTWKAGPGYTYTAAGDVVISYDGGSKHTNMSPLAAEEIATALTEAAHHARLARIRHAEQRTAQNDRPVKES